MFATDILLTAVIFLDLKIHLELFTIEFCHIRIIRIIGNSLFYNYISEDIVIEVFRRCALFKFRHTYRKNTVQVTADTSIILIFLTVKILLYIISSLGYKVFYYYRFICFHGDIGIFFTGDTPVFFIRFFPLQPHDRLCAFRI